MKITVYNVKGGVGKSRISSTIALDHECAIATNEAFHTYRGRWEDENRIWVAGREKVEKGMRVDPLKEPFPKFPEDLDVVFDLAGALMSDAYSITTALDQSDVVLVPACREEGGDIPLIGTLRQILPRCPRIAVIATKLERGNKERGVPWDECLDFRTVQAWAQSEADVPVFPLKKSKAFESVWREQQSIKEMMQNHPMRYIFRHNYRELDQQIDRIYSYIKGTS